MDAEKENTIKQAWKMMRILFLYKITVIRAKRGKSEIVSLVTCYYYCCCCWCYVRRQISQKGNKNHYFMNKIELDATKLLLLLTLIIKMQEVDAIKLMGRKLKSKKFY